jgi:hypothetical protein
MIILLDIDPSNAFDAQAEKDRGTAGVIIKGGQGMLAYNFKPFVDQCNAVGLPYGIYWVVDARFHSVQEFQVIQKTFLDQNFGRLGLWLDWEKPIWTMPDAEYGKLPYAGYKDCSGLISLLKAWTNQLKGIYTGLGFWKLVNPPTGDPDTQGTAEWFAAQCLLWIARYKVSEPGTIGAWLAPTMWQFREGPDYSFWMGTDDEWNQFIGHPANPIPTLTASPKQQRPI